MRGGLTVPSAVRMARSECQESQDVFARFIRDAMETSHISEDEVQASYLQQRFRHWFEGEGLPDAARPSEVVFGA